MIINKLTASFGKLENDSLELHDGLNVIYAPNESGKSTWCALFRPCFTALTAPSVCAADIFPISCAMRPGPEHPWRAQWR